MSKRGGTNYKPFTAQQTLHLGPTLLLQYR